MIVNADDFGRTLSINEAVHYCFEKDYISQTTIMVNMPFFEDAILISKRYSFFSKVGLHLSLDEGVPLTESMKNNPHFCKSGFFQNNCFMNLKSKFYLSSFDRQCVEDEIQAQMQRYISSGFTLMHLDSHHHIHINFSVIRIIKCLGTKYGFKSIRIAIESETDSFPKKIYKIIMNKYLSKSFSTTKVCVPFSLTMSREEKKESIEIMMHPDIINGHIVDVICRNPLEIQSIKNI